MEGEPVSAQLPWDLFGTSANTDTPDANGCTWTVASSEGWDAPDQRTEFTSPTSQHGVYGSNRYADGRPVIIRGLVFAPTQEAAWLAYDRITSGMPGLMDSGDIVSYEPVPKMLTVHQAGPPRVSKPADGRLRFELALIAEYPWKRALSAVTVPVAAGDSETFTPAGTFAAEVIVTTTSTGTVDFGAGGLTLRASSVASGTVFDSLERTVTSAGGADLFGSTLPGIQWPAVAVGSNTFVNNGTADVELSYFPTYA
jgi:hypothetical protein